MNSGMTDFDPAQLNRMDTRRLAAYRSNLDFYRGNHWPTQSRHRQLVFNYARVAVDKITSFLVPGLNFACYPINDAAGDNAAVKAKIKRAEQLLRQVYEENNLRQLDYETEIDAAVLGDGCYKVIWDTDEKRIRITTPDISGLYAWWLGDDISRVWRVASRYTLTGDEVEMLYSSVIASAAKQSHGIATSPRVSAAPRNDRIVVTEVWTDGTFDLFLDNDLVESRPNPYGFIPFVIFPNLREPKKFWGTSDIPALIQPQRELNRALSQLSRILELSGNPIAVLENISSPRTSRCSPVPCGRYRRTPEPTSWTYYREVE